MSKNIDKKQIIDAAVKLVKEKNGSSSLTIREIASVLGCSHPNIYNYYGSLDELRWDVVEALLQRMMSLVIAGQDGPVTVENRLAMFLERLIIYYLDNTGWYRIVWFDELKGKMPANTRKIAAAPRVRFSNFLGKIYPDIDNDEILLSVTDTVHNYIHGQMAKYINGRGMIGSRAELIQITVNTAVKIVSLMINDSCNSEQKMKRKEKK